MRFSRLLQVGAVGTWVLAPALAQNANAPQDQALDALRREVGRDRWAQQYEERERVRQQQRAHEAAAMRAAGLAKPDLKDPYVRASAMLRGEAVPGQPILMAAAESTTPALAPSTTPPLDAAAQQRALEILRQSAGRAPAPAPAPAAVAVESSTPEPTPETRERVRQILEEQAPPRQPRNLRVVETPAAPAAAAELTPISADAETRARELLRQKIAESKAAAPASPLDAKTQEMLRRQDEEIARRAASPAPEVTATPGVTARPIVVPAAPATVSSTPAVPAVPVAAPAPVEVTARPVPAPPTAASAAPTVAAQPAPLPQAPAPIAAVPYSAEVEEQARQAIRQRSQVQTAPASPAATAAAHAQTISTPAPAPQPVGTTPEPAVSAGPKTKREKLDELNALYRADKVTPAEYHERRARILAEP